MTTLSDLPHFPSAPKNGQTLSFAITGLDEKGRGTGLLRAAIGPQRDPRAFSCHVSGARPGDQVTVRVLKRRKNTLTAHLLSLDSASVDRVEPRCPHAQVSGADHPGCGGCRLQDLSYQAQLDAKRHRLRTALDREGLTSVQISEVWGAEEPWYYRNKMEFTFGFDGEGRPSVGLHPAGYKYEVMALETCFLQSPEVAKLLPALAQWLKTTRPEHYNPRENTGFLRTITFREGKRTGDRLVELTTTGDERTQWAGEEAPSEAVVGAMTEAIRSLAATHSVGLTSVIWTRHIAAKGIRTRMESTAVWGESSLSERLELGDHGSLVFDIHPRAFFQTNSRQAETLYRRVIEMATQGREELGTVLDLYCGTGTIGLALARVCERVIGIELNPEGVASARKNAADNGIGNAEFHAGDVGETLDALGLSAQPVDLAVVDPPRAGLNAQAREQVCQLSANRVVYVSCNPDSLANDLVYLRKRGFAIGEVEMVDMFPHTAHLESVVVLNRT
ncbi:MAG: 23S rRNA (uracil(1939)-C(5))-methyltransferase RlmD [Myxococcales bacterium]|nr:23S rRNA (uracil(1939)-C(5))-methyltransferase RlmD [Myxococcales bacterium]